jgi:putative endonuclease
MWFVYVLRSEINEQLYVGMSESPDTRLLEHNKGKVRSTKSFRPWKRVFLEEVGDTVQARKREKYLKSGVGKEWLKKKLSSEG